MTTWWESSSGNSMSKQVNTQKLVQDQNYSHKIFFGLLSTIESIVQFY
jgi:hypothetical protein